MRLSQQASAWSIFLALAILGSPALAQKKRKVDSPPPLSKIKPSDVRRPQLANASSPDIELGDGFRAFVQATSICVHIPGAYMDTLSSSRIESLTIQLAAAAFVKVANTKDTTAAEALSNSCLGSKSQQRVGEEVTYHSFKLSNGRIMRIFVYLNELDGITAVIEIPTKSLGKP